MRSTFLVLKYFGLIKSVHLHNVHKHQTKAASAQSREESSTSYPPVEEVIFFF